MLIQIFKAMIFSLGLVACQSQIAAPPSQSGVVGDSSSATYVQALVKRPDYQVDADDTRKVKVVFDEESPQAFVIGGQMYTLQSSLEASLSNLGESGLDEGQAQARTVYYVYAIVSRVQAGSVRLILSAKGPEFGPTGFGMWTYLGGVVTHAQADPEIKFSPMAKSGDIIWVASETFDIIDQQPPTRVIDLNIPSHSTSVFMELSTQGSYFIAPARLRQDSPRNSSNALSVSGKPFVPTDVFIKDTNLYTSSGWLPLWASRRLVLEAGQVTTHIFPETLTRAQIKGWIEDVSKWP